MSNLSHLEGQAAAVIASLPRTTYTIPESARTATDPKTVTIRQLTSGEEEAALVASNRKGTNFEYEGAKRSIYAIDDRVLTDTNNEREEAYYALSNKVRDLVIRGFTRVAMPTNGEASDFLTSGKTEG